MTADQKEFIPYKPTAPIARCWWVKTEGNFNFLRPTEKSWQVYLYVEFTDGSKVCLSDTWDLEDEPNIVPSDYPEEVVDLLATRLESWLYTSKLQESRGKIIWMRNNIHEINLAWAKDQLRIAQTQLEEATRKFSSWETSVKCLEQEIAEADLETPS